MKAKLRRRLGAVALLLLAASAWWGFGERGRLREATAARVATSGASAPAGNVVRARALVTPASDPSAVVGLAERSTESPESHARAVLKTRMKANWCGFGAAEFGRQRQAVYDKARAGGSGDKEATDETERTPGGEVLAEAMSAVRRRWVAVLVQRGDPRSRAVAELLGGVDGDDVKARARLQALARTSSDPMLTALALQMRCQPGACTNVEASQWSRLEPANLHSWLELLRDVGGRDARADQSGYVLERAASEARYSRSYARELLEVLASLPETGQDGLAVDAELRLHEHAFRGPLWQRIGAVREVCEVTPQTDGITVQRCTALVETLWTGDTTPERLFAVVTAMGMFPVQPALRARWASRTREYEAVTMWRRDQLALPAGTYCEAQIEMRKALRQSAEYGEWGHARAQMQSAGVDDAALSARWHRGTGAGASSPPASTAR